MLSVWGCHYENTKERVEYMRYRRPKAKPHPVIQHMTSEDRFHVAWMRLEYRFWRRWIQGGLCVSLAFITGFALSTLISLWIIYLLY